MNEALAGLRRQRPVVEPDFVAAEGTLEADMIEILPAAEQTIRFIHGRA